MGSLGARFRLFFGEYPSNKALTPSLQHRLHPRDADQINADSVNHRTCPKGNSVAKAPSRKHGIEKTRKKDKKYPKGSK
jgi:hypothetical protein